MARAHLDLTPFGLTATQARYTREPDQLGGELVHRLVALFASEAQAPFVYETPASWWQHLKLSFPAWLLNHFPARMQRREVSVRTVYPFLKTKLPQELFGPQVVVMVADKVAGAFLPETEGLSRFEYNQEAAEIMFKDRRISSHSCPICRRSMFVGPPPP